MWTSHLESLKTSGNFPFCYLCARTSYLVSFPASMHRPKANHRSLTILTAQDWDLCEKRTILNQNHLPSLFDRHKSFTGSFVGPNICDEKILGQQIPQRSPTITLSTRILIDWRTLNFPGMQVYTKRWSSWLAVIGKGGKASEHDNASVRRKSPPQLLWRQEAGARCAAKVRTDEIEAITNT